MIWVKIYFTKFSENHNPFCKIFEIIFTSLIFQSILNKNKKNPLHQGEANVV
ncbi:Uncharacterised protein [Streptococcus pneumoniae]|nr:Uncharacterised protein [Streptococcus pneumoniae]